VPEAADALGVTVDAIRSRVKRGTIDHVREGGRVYVLLGADQDRPGHDQGTDRPGESTTLISQMQARIDSLEGQLDEANERDRENRRIIAALTSRIPAIEAPSDAEATDADETVDEQGRGQPRSDAQGPQTGAQRPWWRRMFRQ
jgi:hypothetical protein